MRTVCRRVREREKRYSIGSFHTCARYAHIAHFDYLIHNSTKFISVFKHFTKIYSECSTTIFILFSQKRFPSFYDYWYYHGGTRARRDYLCIVQNPIQTLSRCGIRVDENEKILCAKVEILIYFPGIYSMILIHNSFVCWVVYLSRFAYYDAKAGCSHFSLLLIDFILALANGVQRWNNGNCLHLEYIAKAPICN